jgi:hypothetical protein
LLDKELKSARWLTFLGDLGDAAYFFRKVRNVIEKNGPCQRGRKVIIQQVQPVVVARTSDSGASQPAAAASPPAGAKRTTSERQQQETRQRKKQATCFKAKTTI